MKQSDLVALRASEEIQENGSNLENGRTADALNKLRQL